ncbi:MAG: HRDC domain-containing protein [Nitriliruptorales bacterium]
MEIRLVDDPATVEPALAEVDDPVVGVDVERADGDRYFRSAALVQVGIEGRCVLLDATALADLEPLDRFLEGRLAVLHAAENDVESLEAAAVRVAGRDRPLHEQIADTAAAAALLGLPLGLGPLLAELLDVALTDDKERFQRADWTERPLSDEMAAYAAGDVVHLPRLWAELDARLEAAGRREWYEQELATLVAQAREDRRTWRRVRGAGRLDGHGRAVLRAVWEEREELARSRDIAPQRIARDEALLAIAQNPPATLTQLSERGVRGQQIREFGTRFLSAVRQGTRSPDEPAIKGQRAPDEGDRGTYDRMRRARAAVARELGIDAGVVCPSRVLMPAILSDPLDADELCEAAGLRPWQTELLRDALWDAYTGS